jgi:cell division protein FtsI (penicillin-binding protein 3)
MSAVWPGLERLAQASRSAMRVRATSPIEQTRDRLMVTAACIVLAFGAISLKLADATLLNRAAEPARSLATDEPIAPAMSRAEIVDRNGNSLATSLAVQSLYADAAQVIDPAEAVRKLAGVIPDLDFIDTLGKLSSGKRFVWIRRNLSPRQVNLVHNLGIPGVYFQREERRIYPAGAIASHAVGYTDLDNNGLAGMEHGLDKKLRSGPERVVSSIDLRLQHILRAEMLGIKDEFSASAAVGMIYDVRNGELLSMVSLPDFDPQNPPTEDKEAMFNRATLGVYEMGSTFKIFNTAMVLDSGRVKPTDTFDAIHNIEIGRFTIRDYHSENRMLSVAEIFEVSSNLGSVRMMQTVGAAAQKTFMGKMGFLKPAELEVSENGWPIAPNPWREINAMTISFGHGLSVSPVHVVAAAAATINGGILVKPTLLKRPAGEAPAGDRVISEQTSQQMRKLFRLVVAEGTAKSANVPGYLVGGKTGTADKQAKQGHGYAKNARRSSFVGAFPMHDPRYLVYVLLDDPKGTKKTYGFATAGWVAAPAVGRVIARIAPILGVPQVDETAPEIRRAVEMNPTAPLPVTNQKPKGSAVASVQPAVDADENDEE